jgi:calcium-dependent protein kinase
VLNQDYDSLSDIWSAGVVMYILLCGHPPFKGSTETGTLRQVKAGACNRSGTEDESLSSWCYVLALLFSAAEAVLLVYHLAC